MSNPQDPRSGRVARTVFLVAKREVITRARTKSFLISNAVILLLILAGIIVASALSGGSASAAKLGLVGSAASLSAPLKAAGASSGNPVDTSAAADEASARAKLASGRLDVAVIPRRGGSYTAVAEKKISTQLRSLIASAVRQQAVSAALRAQGVNPATLTQAADRASVTIDAVHPPKPHSAQRTALAYIALLLMFFQILAFGLYVAIGVVEEKSSRVVEVLLATIKPLHLLCGKVLGIGVVGLVQLAAYGVVGLGAGIGTGLVTVTGTAVGVFASVLVWFILGYAFFAMLYAAAGSLVSRQEDVNSVATPITLLIMVSYFLAQATVRDSSGTLASVMSWIPPFSAMLMPLRIAAGVTNPAQIIGSALLMLLATAALALVAARIYQRSVLRTGKRLSWTDAVRRSGAL